MEAENPTHPFWTPERIEKAVPIIPKDIEQVPIINVNAEIIDDIRKTTPPYNSVGIFLFTMGGKNFFGSAYAVKVPPRPPGEKKRNNIIFTAGHNLERHDREPLEYAKNICFVPAMLSDGSAPFGMFDAIDEKFGNGFQVCEDFEVIGLSPQLTSKCDFGAVILGKYKGKDIGELVPLLDVEVDQQYDGNTSFKCIGYSAIGTMRQVEGKYEGEDNLGNISKLGFIGEGSSGGPWFRSGNDKVNGHGVFIQKDDDIGIRNFSPYYSKTLIDDIEFRLQIAEMNQV